MENKNTNQNSSSFMAEGRRYGISSRLDIDQILLEAQHRWLRPAEVCEILQNYRKFQIAPDPPNRPLSGSLFLFDRKVLRYFRKDGHNWRKKKDGKTIREAHERLKAGSVDVLHCYYAHGEENENFQRRSYWMLDEEYEHIVLVHYREVKGNKASLSRTSNVECSQNSRVSSPSQSPSIHSVQGSFISQSTNASDMRASVASEYEDVESENPQTISSRHSLLELQRPDDAFSLGQNPGLFHSSSHISRDIYGTELPNLQGSFTSLGHVDLSDYTSKSSFGTNTLKTKTSSDGIKESATKGVPTAAHPFSDYSGYSLSSKDTTNMHINDILEQLFTDELSINEDITKHDIQREWQVALGGSSYSSAQSINYQQTDEYCQVGSDYTNLDLRNLTSDSDEKFIAREHGSEGEGVFHLTESSPLSELKDIHRAAHMNSEGFSAAEPKSKHLQKLSNNSLEGESFKKSDSFTRWMSKELGDMDEPLMAPYSRSSWTTEVTDTLVGDSNISQHPQVDADLLSPSLSQEQLFSILDFSPDWTYSGSETKVLITGKFLNKYENLQKWSCMFGEVEVPADVIAPGVLRCHAPAHKVGTVPFYITCCNRLACSEVREFEYRDTSSSRETPQPLLPINEMLLCMRFAQLLSLGSRGHNALPNSIESAKLYAKINSLLKEDGSDWSQMEELVHVNPRGSVKDYMLQKLLKENLQSWLLFKAVEGGKGPNVLDKDGQGVLHLAAALNYEWALAPIVAAGVNVNFRDNHGWTALHWAAFYGRERIVIALLALGGAPGALTDPTTEFPSGRTPADLASSNGHKGIAGYLAESALTSHLSTLTLKESLKDNNGSAISGGSDVETFIGVRTRHDGEIHGGSSMKDSLSAVRNAAQAAARIHQVFRVQSFQRKQLIEYGNENCGISQERALSFISVQKPSRLGQKDDPKQFAAIKIQNKFRGWKGKKEFLIIRQRIIKIQAHVRGHQVRKQFRKIVWSVGIVEKAILRWRRKGSGLRGFKPEGSIEGPMMQIERSNVDDYDFLKEGRRQTEERLQKALARVKSMVQYPEARDQYQRLLNVVTEYEQTKVEMERLSNSVELFEIEDSTIIEAEDNGDI